MLLTISFRTRREADDWMDQRKSWVYIPEGHEYIDHRTFTVTSKVLRIEDSIYGITRSYVKKEKGGYVLRIKLSMVGHITKKQEKWRLLKTILNFIGKKKD